MVLGNIPELVSSMEMGTLSLGILVRGHCENSVLEGRGNLNCLIISESPFAYVTSADDEYLNCFPSVPSIRLALSSCHFHLGALPYLFAYINDDYQLRGNGKTSKHPSFCHATRHLPGRKVDDRLRHTSNRSPLQAFRLSIFQIAMRKLTARFEATTHDLLIYF
jgi:hypothetical protein